MVVGDRTMAKEQEWTGIKKLEELFHMLGNRHRLEILTTLVGSDSPYSFTGLKEKLDYDSRTLSFHVGCLITSGMVQRKVQENEKGHYAMYEITEKGRGLLQKYNITPEKLR